MVFLPAPPTCTGGRAGKLGRNGRLPGGILAFIPGHVLSALAVAEERTDLGGLCGGVCVEGCPPAWGSAVCSGKSCRESGVLFCYQRAGLQGKGIMAAIHPFD